MDHLSSTSIKKHLDLHLGKAQDYFGNHFGNTLRAIFTDSLELSSDWLWTKDFLKEFASKFQLNLQKVEINKKPWLTRSTFGRLRESKKYDRFFYLTDGSFFFSLAKKNIAHFQIPFKIKPRGLINELKLKNWKIKVSNSLFTKKIIEDKLKDTM